MGSHSRLSPSSAHRWSRCPGSVKAEEGRPNPSSPHAMDGTITHALCEKAIKRWGMFRDADVKEYMKGKTVFTLCKDLVDEVDCDDFEVEPEHLDRVQKYLDYVIERVETLENIYGTHCEVFPETKVDAGPLIGCEGVRGTADCVLVCGDVIEIIDYKDGHGIVEANDNEQLLLYALGAIEMVRTPFDIPVKEVHTTIVQPKVVPPIKMASYGLEQVLQMGAELAHAAKLTEDANPLRVAGKKQCHWCLARGDCEEQQLQAIDEIRVLFEDVPLPEMGSTVEEVFNDIAAATPRKVGELTDDDLAGILSAQDNIEAAMKAAKDEAHRRANTGGKIPGYKLVAGRSSRKWSLSDSELHEFFRKEVKLKESDCWTKTLLSPAQAEKLTLSKAKSAMLKEKVVKQRGNPTLVPLSDKREEIITDAARIFDLS